MDWVRLIGKMEPSPQLLAEERFTFVKPIATVVSDHDRPSDLSVNNKYNGHLFPQFFSQ